MTINQFQGDGDPEAEERFWSQVRLRSPELTALADREPMFATLAGLASGGDDAAGRAAARVLLGRWIHRHRLLPEHLRIFGTALSLSHVLCDAPARADPMAGDWDRAYQRLTAELMRAAWRIGDGPAWWSAELIGHARPAEGIAVLTVRPDRPLPFQPGQAVPVSLPAQPGVWRWYCPANAPRADGTIELHVRAVAGGREVTLVVGARTVEQLYDATTLDRWQDAYDWLTVLPAFSDEPAPVHPLERGTAARIALRHEWPDHDVFLCGPTPMIHDALPRLVVAGVPLTRIHLPETYEMEESDRSGAAGRAPGGPGTAPRAARK